MNAVATKPEAYPRPPVVGGWLPPEQEIVELDRYMGETGLAFEVIDCHAGGRRLRWHPAVGDRVSYSINGDTYAEGEVVKLTRASFTTSTGETFRWSRRLQSWRPKGGHGFAHPRSDSRRDVSF